MKPAHSRVNLKDGATPYQGVHMNRPRTTKLGMAMKTKFRASHGTEDGGRTQDWGHFDTIGEAAVWYAEKERAQPSKPIHRSGPGREDLVRSIATDAPKVALGSNQPVVNAVRM